MIGNHSDGKARRTHASVGVKAVSRRGIPLSEFVAARAVGLTSLVGPASVKHGFEENIGLDIVLLQTTELTGGDSPQLGATDRIRAENSAPRLGDLERTTKSQNPP